MIHTLLLLVIGAVALAACGGQGGASSEGLPLAKDRPTFLFFYTDN
jgi:hypothetical protein